MGWLLNQELNSIKHTQWQKTQLSSSARRLTSRRRWCDRTLETERLSSEWIWVLSILVWWCMEEQDGRRRRQQESILILYWSVRVRNALPPSSSHSGRNPIDLTLQDKVFNPNSFFEYIYHLGRAVSLHSITNSGLIAGGQNSSRERQTVFFTTVNPHE